MFASKAVRLNFLFHFNTLVNAFSFLDQYHTDDVRIKFWDTKVQLDAKRLEKYGTANFIIDYANFWNQTLERESFS